MSQEKPTNKLTGFVRWLTSIFKSNEENPNTDLPTHTAPPSPQQAPARNADTTVLRYGNTTVTLNKSQRFVAQHATKSRGGMESNNESAQDTLNGFALIDMQATKSRSATNANEAQDGFAVYHFSDKNEAEALIPSGEIYLVFNNNTSMTQRQQVLQSYAWQIKEQRGIMEYILQADPAMAIGIVVQLQQNPAVSIAEPDLISRPSYATFTMPSDELLSDLWHLRNTGQHGEWSPTSFKKGADAKVIDAWEHLGNMGDPQIVVAVIDSGFDLQHPDLGGSNKVVAPYDFETETTDPNPRLGDWHGTCCAGVAVGSANGIGIVGVAPMSKLMPLRFSGISDSQVEKWFNYCMEKKADVVSNSWGSADSEFVMSTRMFNAIKRCATEGRNGKGCVIVFAAGNTNRNINAYKPDQYTGFATHPNVIAVAASNSKDEKATYSNYGKSISICAPSNGAGGAGITTADVTGTIDLPDGQIGFKGYDEGDYTYSFGGTSSACPLVAGVAALVLSANKQLTAQQVKNILENTTDKIGSASDYSANGHSVYFGFGRINALKAVQKAQNPAAINSSGSPIASTSNTTNTSNTPQTNNTTNPTVMVLPLSAQRSATFSAAGQEHVYALQIGGTLNVQLDSSTSGNDFDLYIKRNALPDPSKRIYDFSSADEGSSERISIAQVNSGSYYLLLRAYQGAGMCEMVANFNTIATNARPLSLTAKATTQLSKVGQPSAYYKLSIGKRLQVKVNSSAKANIDVYVKKAKAPRWNDYDGRGISKAANETIALDDVSAGLYYILVRCQTGAGDYQLQVQLSVE